MSEGSYQVFKYEKPSDMPGGKAIVQLAGSDIIRGRVQVVREGGENNLHSHRGMDGFWMVLAGRVRFTAQVTSSLVSLVSMRGY